MQEPVRSSIYKDISSQTKLDVATVNQIVQFMFGEVKRTIDEGNLQQVDLQYLGSWYVKPYRKEKLEEKGVKPKVRK